MRILVCGGRDFGACPDNLPGDHPDRLESEKEFKWGVQYLENKILYSLEEKESLIIITGMARGADIIGLCFGEMYANATLRYPADWDTHGKKAGPIRNQQMIDEGKPDLVIAFPGGNGTADMIRRAKKHNIEVIEVEYKESE